VKTWTVVTLAALGTLGIAHAASKAKCRARQRSLQQTFGTTDEAKLRALAKQLGGSYPDCSGVTLFSEGV
jgi:hypothetical protein